VKIGFIGETLTGTARLVGPGSQRGLRFLDEAATANRYAERLKRQGVKAIVLLIHEGGRQRDADADPNRCNDFSGPIVDIAERLSPDIKVVISGHSHWSYTCTIAGHTVTNASSFGRLLTRVNLRIDSKSGAIVDVATHNTIVTRDVPKDAAQSRIVAKYARLLAPLANRVVGSISEDIPRQHNRAGESPLGDLVADAQLAATRRPESGGAVVAFMNLGGIRGDLTADHQVGDERPGEITYSELFTIQPFSNTLVVLTMTGNAIRRILEQQFADDKPDVADVLQVSNGFTYRYDLTAPPGRRVDPGSIKIDGKLVAPEARVRVAASNFLVEGGDGFTVFAEGTDRVGGEVDIDALAAYFKAQSPIKRAPQDRIARTD
jgi:2',3'-cyclic-nucleotide 2'-phosphodiesterase (5'-nucleotidase family)